MVQLVDDPTVFRDPEYSRLCVSRISVYTEPVKVPHVKFRY